MVITGRGISRLNKTANSPKARSSSAIAGRMDAVSLIVGPPLCSFIIAPFLIRGRRGLCPEGGERRLDFRGVRPRSLVAPGRCESLVPAVEGQVDVSALAVPAFQVPKCHDVALVVVVGSQDKGV